MEREDHITRRLVLGTAQLGLAYGLANKTGQPGAKEVRAIVATAWENGIREFDTAQGYGQSELALGRALGELGLASEAKVITKLNPALDHADPETLSQAVEQSLQNLGLPRLAGLLLHQEERLDELQNGLGGFLKDLKKMGVAERVGVSVYSPDRALAALGSDLMEIVQVPANLLDDRFNQAGVFELAGRKGKQVYIRSVFLQGLLLLEPAELSEKMGFTRPLLSGLRGICQELNVSPQRLALSYVRFKYPQSKIIFGAETSEQVVQNVNDWSADPPEGLMEAARLLEGADERTVNPALWPG